MNRTDGTYCKVSARGRLAKYGDVREEMRSPEKAGKMLLQRHADVIGFIAVNAPGQRHVKEKFLENIWVTPAFEIAGLPFRQAIRISPGDFFGRQWRTEPVKVAWGVVFGVKL